MKSRRLRLPHLEWKIRRQVVLITFGFELPLRVVGSFLDFQAAELGSAGLDFRLVTVGTGGLPFWSALPGSPFGFPHTSRRCAGYLSELESRV